ncbi:MAG: methyltransferase family protein, partial [Pirellulaceae bacterium]
MTLETAFRMAIALSALAAAVMAASLRMHDAQPGSKRKLESTEPKTDQKTRQFLALIATVLGGLVAGVVLFPQGMAPWRMGLSSFWRGVGIPVVLVGLRLFHQSLTALGQSWANSDRPRSDSLLVTNGPYRWVRHPYYSATFLLLVGISLLANQWPIAIGAIILSILLGLRAGREEVHLAERFGNTYLDYQSRTGMFFPKAALPASDRLMNDRQENPHRTDKQGNA